MTCSHTLIATKPKDRHGYVYLIVFTRPTDGTKFYYVGQHVSKTLDKSYLGSGVWIKRLQAKYGLEGNFYLCILNWCYDQEELNFHEVFHIYFLKQLYPKTCTNFMFGGVDGKLSDAGRARLRKAAKARYRNLTDEEYSELCEQRSAARQAMPEERARLMAKRQGEALRKTWEEYTEAERKERSKTAARSVKAALARDGENIRNRRSKSLTAYWDNLPSKEWAARSMANKLGQLNRSSAERKATARKRKSSWAAKPESEKVEWRKKLSRARTENLTTLVCPHCSKAGTNKSAMERWHFSNCAVVEPVKRIPCKSCGKKLDPRGAGRHYAYCA